MKKIFFILFLITSRYVYAQSNETNNKFEEAISGLSQDSLHNLATTEIIRSAGMIEIDENKYKDQIESQLNFSIEILEYCQNKFGKSNFNHSWIGLGLFYFKEYQQATVEFSLAIQLNTSDFHSYKMRANCKTILNDNYGANEDYAFAINYAPMTYNRLVAM